MSQGESNRPELGLRCPRGARGFFDAIDAIDYVDRCFLSARHRGTEAAPPLENRMPPGSLTGHKTFHHQLQERIGVVHLRLLNFLSNFFPECSGGGTGRRACLRGMCRKA